MKKFFILSILALTVLTSCDRTVDLAIDNPTKFELEITVDTLRVMVPPKDVVWVEMGPGEHQLTLENDSIIKFNFQESVYMINASQSEYLVSTEYYGTHPYENPMYPGMKNPLSKEVTFLGFPLEGEYEVITDVINKVTWDYGPRESLPEMIEMDSSDSYDTLKKVYDPREFMDMLQSAYDTYEE
ncbi:MAG: hypothetical protein HRU50_11335 [Winogradskyella sp.]|uniref:hypothetical protein n=1 Tax=Winogradskyella sp. TaxID=1883156 RepID=UPI0025FD7182|nr:hypothetical protein [Winogradskyella sp.]NRB60515.1 hypothetical protein [Winogradskyella sp.]